MVGDHINEILECDSFETIVDYLKLTLPEKVPTNADDICNRVLNMDITSQLHLYEVEYQLLKDEMIDIRQNKEKLEKQEVVHRELENELARMQKELFNTNQELSLLKTKFLETKKERNMYKKKLSEVTQQLFLLQANSVNNINGSTGALCNGVSPIKDTNTPLILVTTEKSN